MFPSLEFLFQGFIEWVYGLILDIWNYFSSALLNVMTLDFAYIKTHIPIVSDISQVLLAVGWALLLGNLVFQALRSMVAGPGFEGEDPKLLFARTFVFGFLLLASPQICETVLTLTSKVITLLEIPDAINVHLVDSSVFGVLGASWILVIIFDVITMFMVLSLLLEVAERYMVLAMLTIMAPLAFAMGGSKSTSEIFTGWCRMFGSMCFLTATNIVFFKMLLSVVSTVPSFPNVFLWMVLIVSIVKVAKKADEIITRIGLNPAITGNKSTLPGVLAYTVFRTALSIATKGAANGIGGALGIAGKGAAGARKGAAGLAGKAGTKGTAGAVGRAGRTGVGTASQQSSRPRYGGGRKKTNTQQEHTRQGQQTQQNNTTQTQTSSRQQTATQGRTTNGRTAGPQGTIQEIRSARKPSVSHGSHRIPGFAASSSGQEKNMSHSSEFHRASSSAAVQSTTQKKTSQTMQAAQNGTAGMRQPTASTKRPPAQQGQRAVPSATKVTPASAQPGTVRTQRPGPIQQEPRQPAVRAKSAEGGSAAGLQSDTGMRTRSSQRPSLSEPRHSRNGPSSTTPSSPGAQRSGPAQQERRGADRKTRPQAKDKSPRPGTAGTGTGPHTPPGQKLSGGPASQSPTRQTKREGGPTDV